jgi:hypothetical protein
VALLSLPLGWFLAHDSQRRLTAMTANPAAYIEHARRVAHPSFFVQFISALIMLSAIVFLVEGIAGLLPRRSPADSTATVA